MKKKIWGLFFVATLLLLVGCGNKVTTETLKKNEWKVTFDDGSKDEDMPSFFAEFSDHIMNLSFDTDSLGSSAEDEWEAAGEEFAKNLLSSMSYKVEYELKGKNIHLKEKDLEIDNDFTVSKDGDKIIFQNDKDKKKKIVLTPVDSKKDKKKTSKKDSTEKTTESTEESKTETSSNQVASNKVAEGSLPINPNSFSTKELTFNLTKAIIIQPGESGNEYGDKPVLAIWYDTTNNSDNEHSPMDWISCVEAIQDNNPNKVNTLNVGSTPDETVLDDQSATIKKDGTLTSAVAYELSDTTTDVILELSDYQSSKKLKPITIKLQN